MPKPTHWTRCTAQARDGSFCDAPSIPEAPFPVCIPHAASLYRFIRTHAAAIAGSPEHALDAVANLFDQRRLMRDSALGIVADRDSVVYYVQVGNLIKIGTTVDIKKRLPQFPPNRRLLATEPGSYELEKQRHQEFRHLLDVGREWFRAEGELLDHVILLGRKRSA